MVKPDFAELVYDNNGIGKRWVFQKPIEQSRFARAQKAGDDRNRNRGDKARRGHIVRLRSTNTLAMIAKITIAPPAY